MALALKTMTSPIKAKVSVTKSKTWSIATRDGPERCPVVGQGNDNVPADRDAIAQKCSSLTTLLVGQRLDCGFKLTAPILVVPEHVETRASRRHQYDVAGRCLASCPLNCFPQGPCYAHRCGSGPGCLQERRGFPDQNGVLDPMPDRFRQPRKIAAFIPTARNQPNGAIDSLECLQRRIDVRPFRIIHEADAASFSDQLQGMLKPGKRGHNATNDLGRTTPKGRIGGSGHDVLDIVMTEDFEVTLAADCLRSSRHGGDDLIAFEVRPPVKIPADPARS